MGFTRGTGYGLTKKVLVMRCTKPRESAIGGCVCNLCSLLIADCSLSLSIFPSFFFPSNDGLFSSLLGVSHFNAFFRGHEFSCDNPQGFTIPPSRIPDMD